MHAQKIIVIHPGSLNLRIGRASDLNPITILHAIGRRRKVEQKHDTNLVYHDPLLPSIVADKENEIMQEFEESRLQVSHSIQTHVTQYEERGGGAKRMRVATPPQQIATFNRRSVPEELPLEPAMKTEITDIQVEGKEVELNKIKENIFDEDIIKLNTDQACDYNIHFPMKRGDLNLHNNIGGSMTAVISDLESIWSHVIVERMSIPRRTLGQYGAVLVINDIYNRSVLRELVTLLLQRLGFRACFLVQDHVAATFGAGLGYACVVDVGDQKCSISCVEDGISHPDTRVRLGYGSGDLSQVFLALLRKCSFPYKECNVEECYADAILINNLKELYCHLNLEICGAQEKVFEVKKPDKRLRYTFQLGDECVVAPLAFFHTELFNLTGKNKVVQLQMRSSQQSDPEDCFDAEYIRETGRVRNGRGDQLLDGAMPITGDAPDEELVVVDNFDVDERSANVRNMDKEEQLYYTSGNGQIIPIDLAIVRSIERCISDDMKRKMYGSILLVGGGSKLSGFAKWLEQKIILHVRSAEQYSYEVNVCVKEMDASMIAWKGAAIMSCLESAPELWLFADEWKKFGLRILREKSIFMW
ncbi:actin-related protein 8 [Musca vetustissima]|uniref:actin-related protein 8 n=1 Tax=Musca vetustissima TaxID=27455 RepID=UPI002AB70698|nr:actin-related protein 8 [Musca vetustissima]